MISLNLSARPLKKLPASAFPSRADVYVCDSCGRDITRHFFPGRAHTWAEMGPERYLCICGQMYMTGATEWDHLSEWERRRRARDTIAIGLISSAVTSVFGVLAYLVLHFVFWLQQGAIITGLVITAIPFLLIQITFWPGVAASKRRTRIGISVASERN